MKNLLLGWAAGLTSLIIAGAGMSATLAGSATTETQRLSFAAMVLGCYAAIVGVIVTERSDRTRLRCLLWGGGVPVLVGWVTTLVVTVDAGLGAGLVAGSPWLVGPLLVTLIGPRLPGFHPYRWIRDRLDNR